MRKERPILFSTMMVQALLAGRKTMTRRVIKEPWLITFLDKLESTYSKQDLPGVLKRITTDKKPEGGFEVPCRYGQIGDLIWVRENWQYNYLLVNKSILYEPLQSDIVYQADDLPASLRLNEKWKPSIHLKKDHARIWLEITDIKIERLMDISEADAINEGVDKNKQNGGYKDYFGSSFWFESAVDSFQSLWDAITDPQKVESFWDSNPWVWCLTLKVLSCNQKQAITELEAAKA